MAEVTSCEENLQNISNLLTVLALELVGKDKLVDYLTIIKGGSLPEVEVNPNNWDSDNNWGDDNG
ncbi:MAG: hypothetical protein DRG78_03805 [Epsilonproteobacteria bacterium]|nr:MAG: hypothetical protein DRG78_03805 [Campylobacterota bacterium]